ncbi:MAG TPA: alpha/beta hydrolase [Candidatus Limnocylindrales bacterium]|nr:alpha/beta hydrolase [Candidatus Limnocylindrales bacterium]
MALAYDETFDEAGAGPAVVLLHSTAADRRMWDPQMRPLSAAGFRLVRPDFRGYGETPVPDAPYNDTQDMADLLDTLGIRDTAIVAASGGGRVALEFAARWPSRVTSLVLLNTALAGHEPSQALQAFGDREDNLLEAGDIDAATELNVRTWLGPLADEATRAKLFEMQRHAFEVQLAAAEDFPPIRVETDLSAITARALLVSGAHDLPDFREIAATLREILRDAKLIELDWAGHLPSLECPDRINPLLIDFLR